jgi:lysine 2,3-aminomutase
VTRSSFEHRFEKARLHYKERSIWKDLPLERWRDWKWQMRNRITTAEELSRVLPITPQQQRAIERALTRFRFAVTPYYVSLIVRDDPECSIRKQAIPSDYECSIADFDIEDPLNEDGDAVAPGMTHRYPDRVLWVIMHECASLCRHCTRKRKVGNRPSPLTDSQLEEGISYLKTHPEVRDVILSGGDPFLLSDERIDTILRRIREGAPNVEIIRFGTRTPVTMPQRITEQLAETLRRYHPIYVNTHFNVPKEFTAESEAALATLADAGIPLGNQTVLLNGVNDCWALMRKLMHKLTANRVRPYYIYQCDLAYGLEHFRTPVSKGIEVLENLRGHISGLAVPTFVVDAPGGGGKIPVMPNYVVSQHEHKMLLRNFEGRIVAYEEPREYTGMCTEGKPCSYCREAEKEGTEPVGVAGLFDDDPEHIALVPSETPPLPNSTVSRSTSSRASFSTSFSKRIHGWRRSCTAHATRRRLSLASASG